MSGSMPRVELAQSQEYVVPVLRSKTRYCRISNKPVLTQQPQTLDAKSGGYKPADLPTVCV